MHTLIHLFDLDLVCKMSLQKAQLRCLLPKSLLDDGFFPQTRSKARDSDEKETVRSCNFSWSGQRKMPSYMKQLVFPEDFMTGLRTIAMQEDEIYKVSAMLEEVYNKTQILEDISLLKEVSWEGIR